MADRRSARKSRRPSQIHGSLAVLQAGSAVAAGKHERSTKSRLQQEARYFSPSLAGSAGCAARMRSRSARTARAARMRQKPSQQSQISQTATLHSSESMQRHVHQSATPRECSPLHTAEPSWARAMSISLQAACGPRGHTSDSPPNPMAYDATIRFNTSIANTGPPAFQSCIVRRHYST